MLTEALDNVPDQASPATAAWVAARHAEESALLGDKAQALKSWRRAEEAFSIADPDEDRAWSRFLNRDRFETFRVATYLKVGKFDEAQQVADGLLARLGPAEGKLAAVIRENIAAAHLARGSVTEAAQVAQAAWPSSARPNSRCGYPSSRTSPGACCAASGSRRSAPTSRSSP